jgi:hypothetical protein
MTTTAKLVRLKKLSYTNFMLKKITTAFFILFAFLLLANHTYASDNFLTSAAIEYKVHETGITTVTNTITIKNLTSEVQVVNYILNLENLEPINPRAYQAGSELFVGKTREDNVVKLKVIFDELVVGIGKSRTFVITYETDTFALRTGKVWEVVVPKLIDKESFDSYRVTLSVPESFGNTAYISPQPAETKISGGRKVFVFTDDMVENSGITAGFGQLQIFSFNLNYHLENTETKQVESQIAIPPDTSTQKVYYQNISPEPKNVVVDEDGNWLAVYTLEPKEKKDIKVSGFVQIFSKPRRYLTPSALVLLSNTKPGKFWPADDIEIIQLAQTLKTPQKTYDFVVEKLSYDYDRVKPTAERLGAKRALENPDEALCMEFTDLFITLARAAGIPAREINGYAYTENPKLEPLSLVADVLHAWPEYWSKTENNWVPVDPTWGATTQGVDYFNKLDLRHFAFVIHSKNSSESYPPGSYKLGDNPQKDVHVSFGEFETLPEERSDNIQISFSKSNLASLFSKNLNIEIENKGMSAIYNLAPDVKFDGVSVKSDYLQILAPHGKYLLPIKISYGILGSKTPASMTVEVGNMLVDIPTGKSEIIIYQLVILSTVLLVILIAVYIKLKKPKLTKIIRVLKRTQVSHLQ